MLQQNTDIQYNSMCLIKTPAEIKLDSKGYF